MKLPRWRKAHWQDFERDWGDLATYNAEEARGIVHSSEWDDRMREKQRLYEEWIRSAR